MSTRGRKLVELALAVNAENENTENDFNISNINQIDDYLLDTNMKELLSPEEVAEIIENAEVIFEDGSHCGYNNVANSSEEETIIPEINLENHTSNTSIVEGTKVVEQQIINAQIEESSEIENSDTEYVPDILSEENSETETNLNRSSSESETNNGRCLKESEHGQQKRKKGHNKRKINKKLRMTGKSYLGFRKPKAQKNTFHDVERKLKERCNCCDKARDPTRKCFLITNDDREKIFQKFWIDMTWEQRKVFVSNTVKTFEKQRPKKNLENSRRTQTLKYSILVDNKIIPVCKKMYLNTIGIGEWSARSWAMKSDYGMNNSNEKELSRREKRIDIFDNERKFLTEFLLNLNKLPSHYCRKDTSRLYLEQTFQSWSDLYKVYKQHCEEKAQKSMSIITMIKAADVMNISIFRPRKDQCDICFQFKNNNVDQMQYDLHIERKDLARLEKEKHKELGINGDCHVITIDVQAVKLCPQIPASLLYYKQKLCCHNFTVYNLVNNQATCYWFDETVADGQAATYASFLVNYLEEHFLKHESKKPIIIYSDGCTAQNRNSILANALLYLSEKYSTSITQKYLEKGHNQMECNPVHSVIERALKNKEICLPSDYFKITKQARSKNPYVVKNMQFVFFKNYGHKELLKYSSIKPSKLNNDDKAVVTNIRALKYFDGQISFKLSFSNREFQSLPTRPKKLDLVNVTFPPLFNSPLPITKQKYDHLQIKKPKLPKDCWSFYDQLPFSLKFPWKLVKLFLCPPATFGFSPLRGPAF